MKGLVHNAVAGAIAAAMMVMLKLLLSGQGVLLQQWHYQPFDLAGAEGLRKLALYAAWGAGYGAAYGLLLKALIPGGLLGALALGAVPTLVSALVLPLYQGQAALKEPWALGWLYLHWTFYALCLLFIVGGRGGGKRGSSDD